MTSPRALAFDVFGTVVDWRGSIIRELETFGHTNGLDQDWAAFADACIRLARDGELRQRLVDAGEHLFESSYQWSTIREDFVALLREPAPR